MCCELVANWSRRFKNFMRFFFSKKHVARLSRDCRATVVRRSCECRREILANLLCENFATLVRLSHECRTILARQSLRLSGEKIKLSDIRTNVVRHSHEYLANVSHKVHSRRLRCESFVNIVDLCREIVSN